MTRPKKIIVGGIAFLILYEYCTLRKRKYSFILFLIQSMEIFFLKPKGCYFSKTGPAAFSPDFGNEKS